MFISQKRLQEIKDWERSKGRDEGTYLGYKYGLRQGYHNALTNEHLVKDNQPHDNLEEDIRRFLRGTQGLQSTQ